MSTECISVDFDERDDPGDPRTALVAVRYDGVRYHVRAASRRTYYRGWAHDVIAWALGEDEAGTERALADLPEEVESAVDEVLNEALEGRLR